MKVLSYIYRKVTKTDPPYYYDYNLVTVILKPIRKWFTNVIAANCPFNCIRILIYRCCGFKIGKKTFIGMRCYLDDMCYDMLNIGNNVIISYGVYFACHGPNQEHVPITICDNVYIGMRSSIITKKSSNTINNGLIIGPFSTIGACTLVNRDIPAYSTAVGVPCKIIEKN